MASEASPLDQVKERPLINPLSLLLGGIFVLGLALIWRWLFDDYRLQLSQTPNGLMRSLTTFARTHGMPIRICLIVGGLIAIGAAISLRLQFPEEPLLGSRSRWLAWPIALAIVPAGMWVAYEGLAPERPWEAAERQTHLISNVFAAQAATPGAVPLGPVIQSGVAGILAESNALEWSVTHSTVAMILLAILLAFLLFLAAMLLVTRLRSEAMSSGLQSSVLLALAGFAVGLGYLALRPEWDSLRLFLRVMTLIAFAGMLLVALPRVLRRTALVLLVVFHFVGILTVVGSLPPPGAQPPWLANYMWTGCYRNYLHFLNMNNSYHFYSPDPGPPTLLWFHVEYADADGKPAGSRWITLPNKELYPTRLEYQRRIAMTEGSSLVYGGVPARIESLLVSRREEAAFRKQILMYPEHELSALTQYREPQVNSKMMFRSFARHVARTCLLELPPHYFATQLAASTGPPLTGLVWCTEDSWAKPKPAEEDRGVKVTGVKVYRVVHEILEPSRMLDGALPYHPATYLPFYQGTFDRDGNLKDPHDPFLYWLIPIIPLSKDYGAAQIVAASGGGALNALVWSSEYFWPFWPALTKPDRGKGHVLDFLKVHAGTETSPATHPIGRW